MKIDPGELKRQVSTARTEGWAPILRQAEQRHGLPDGILLAIASRETNMQDIVGDGGHGRGLFQIDDRAHGDWLAQHGAGAAGALPAVPDAAEYAATLLDQNRAFARKNGVAEAELLMFAASAYNAGCGGALAGRRAGDCDRRTTGGDYGRDVLARLAAIHGGTAPDAPPARPDDGILQKGARGPAVRQLKLDLQAWFELHSPDLWKTFAVAPGPVFGSALHRCVRSFQQLNGLTVDGEVGPATLGALRGAVPASPVPPG